jgi:hypothetical protein
MKVYLVTDGTGLYKIGRSADANLRIKGLQTSNGRELELLYAVDCVHGPKVEAILHRRHATKKSKGEWFALTQEDRERFVMEVKAIDDNLVYIEQNSTLDYPLGR